MKTYEVEFKSTTYRHYYVDAKDEVEAEEKAIEELEMDTEVSSAWVENSKIERIADTAQEVAWVQPFHTQTKLDEQEGE